MRGEGMDHIADTIDGRVDTGGQQGPNQPLGLCFGAFTAIRSREHRCAPTTGFQSVPLANRCHPCRRVCSIGQAFLKQRVARTKGVECGSAVRNQIFASLVWQAHQIGEDRKRERFAKVDYRDLPFWTDIDGALENGAPVVTPGMTLKRGTPETELEQVRPLMLERHTRYMPVMDAKMLMGVISFYDVAKAVVDSQNFENKMLKAYIRDWPEEQ